MYNLNISRMWLTKVLVSSKKKLMLAELKIPKITFDVI